MDATVLSYAFFGGLLPSCIWLYFILKEDARCPEPRNLIALAFFAGMCAVPLALPLQQAADVAFLDRSTLLLAWALIEETLKYLMAASFILWRRQVDEAPDYVIYLITTALGFAAAENMLFLVHPLAEGALGTSFITANLRFLGSTILHVVASAAIGLTFAFSASLHPVPRAIASASGLILAVALHTAFNALIISAGTSSAMMAFFLVWMVAVGVLAALEVLKYMQYRNLPNNTCTTV